MDGASKLRVLYVFRERKLPLFERWRRGEEPDTLLFGLNHLREHGFDGRCYEPHYGPVGRMLASQVGRLGPDLLQLRALPQFARCDTVFLTAGWPLLLFARRLLRRPPKLVWLNLSMTTLLTQGHGAREMAQGNARTARHRDTANDAAAFPRPAVTPSPGHPARSPQLLGLARLRASLLKRALAEADLIACVSRAQQSWLAAATGLPVRRLPHVPSGVDADFHTACASRSDDGYVLAVGRDAGRDYATFIAAVRGLSRPVRIVASPENLRGVQVPPDVALFHNLPPLALRKHYERASCVVVPTHGDGYLRGSDCSGTLVLLDAMATGKPAVITERQSVYDYVSPGQEALIVRPGRAEDLRAAIEHLLETPALAGAMGRAGREAVEEHFNTRRFAAELARLFRDSVS